MARDPFSSASGGAQLKGFVGRLGLFTPTEFKPDGFKGGSFGPTDLIRANVVFLDEGADEPLAAEEAEVYDGMSIINGPVVEELNQVLLANDRKMHLGRVKEIPNKRGQNPVIVLDPPTEEDRALARKYVTFAAEPPKDEF